MVFFFIGLTYIYRGPLHIEQCDMLVNEPKNNEEFRYS
jgi:hypothetical protein